MSLADHMEKMNTDTTNRTYVENLFLSEMIQEDRYDLLKEDIALEDLSDGLSLSGSMFNSSASTDFDSTIDTDNGGELDGSLFG